MFHRECGEVMVKRNLKQNSQDKQPLLLCQQMCNDNAFSTNMELYSMFSRQ